MVVAAKWLPLGPLRRGTTSVNTFVPCQNPVTEEKVRAVEERYDADDNGKFRIIHRLRDF